MVGLCFMADSLALGAARRIQREIFGEPVKAAGPAAAMSIPRADGLKVRLMQYELGPAAQVLERHYQQSLRAYRLSIIVHPAIRPHDSLGRNDFLENTLLPVLLTVGSALVDEIFAARM